MDCAYEDYPPRPAREAAEERASLLLESGGKVGILVRNVSAGGFMAECRRSMQIGSRIAIAWPGDEVRSAQVRWALPGRFGAAFVADEPKG
jgi:hypothetical protein